MKLKLTSLQHCLYKLGLLLAMIIIAAVVMPVNEANALIVFQNNVYEMDAETVLVDADDDAPGDLIIQFGATLAETIGFDTTNTRFEFSDDIRVLGAAEVEGTTSIAGSLSASTSSGVINLGRQGGVWESFQFDTVDGRFEASDDLHLTGGLEVNANIDVNSNQVVEQRIENVSALPGGAPGLGAGGEGRIVILDTTDSTAPGCTVSPNCAAGTYVWDGSTWISLVGAATATNLTKVVTVGSTDADYTTIQAAAAYLTLRSGGIMLLSAETHAVTTSINMTNISMIGKDASRTTVNITGSGQLDSFDTKFKFLTIDADAMTDDMVIDVQTGSTSLVFEFVDIDIQDSGDVLIDSNEGTAPTITAKFIKSNSSGGSGRILKAISPANLNASSEIFVDSRSGDSPLQMEDWDLTLAGGGSVYTTGTITSVPAQSIFVSPQMNLQGAIDSIESTGLGGLITLLPGTHAITSPLTIEDNNIEIAGYGDSSVISASGFSGIDSSTAAIQIGASDGSAPVDGVMLSSFRLNVSSNIHGIRTAGGQDIQIENITVQKIAGQAGSGATAGIGIMALDGTSEQLVRPVIKGNRILGNSGTNYFTDGIHVSSEMEIGGVWGYGTGVDNALVEGNFVDYVRETSYVFVGADNSSLFNNRGTRMGVGGTGAYGIFMGSVTNVNMNANVFTGSLSTTAIGIGIESFNLGSSKSSTDNIFTSNILDGTANSGVGFATGFQIGNASNTIVSRNAFHNNAILGASSGTTVAFTVRGDADQNAFTHNNITGGTNAWDTGIQLQSASQEANTLRDNSFNNVTTILSDSGTATTINVSHHRATTDPTVTDDLNDGYYVGAVWVNTSTDQSFILVDSAVGAADWNRIDESSGTITGVDSNTFTVDQDDTGGDVTLRFGTSNNETLVWNNANSRFNLSDSLLIEDDLYIGSATETISNGGFNLDGDDVFIAGELGVEGPIYTDATATKYLWLDIDGGVRGSASLGTIAGGQSAVVRFDEAGNSQIRYAFPVPDDWVSGTDIIVEVFWSPEDATAGNIDFDLDYAAFTDAEDVLSGSFSAATVPTVSAPGTTQELDQFSITLPAATFAAGDLANIRLIRRPATGTDTYTADLNIHMVRISYTGKKLQ